MISNPSPKRNVHRVGRRRLKLRYFLLVLLGFVVLCVSRPYQTSETRVGVLSEADTPPVAGAVPQELAVPVQAPVTVETYDVRRGNTLYDILRAKGIPDAQIFAISEQRVDGIQPSRLVAGKKYRLYTQGDRVIEYQYEPDDEKILRVLFSGDTPELSVESIPYEVFRVPISGVIEDSLFAAVDAIGEKPSLALDLADLFAWQVDFFRDLRKGDTFEVLVDKFYRDGEFIRYGKILGARFVNNGNSYTGILFTPAGGRPDYFDETGGSLRKQFLKVPLRFQRISSGFSRRRLHPVTGKVTPHLGVDYAAPTGTPIMAIGDGTVLFKKHDSVNGRIIKIRHNSTYSTAYAHMNSFAKGVSKGSRVRQGQVIGYVGKSGRATGPHLHFAMYKNGVYVDPRRISVPRATSVPAADLQAFNQKAEEINRLLEGGPREQVAEGRISADVLR
jgi:murein DD-endopeptidase MepM/ murein hydrolase activator NlpD